MSFVMAPEVPETTISYIPSGVLEVVVKVKVVVAVPPAVRVTDDGEKEPVNPEGVHEYENVIVSEKVPIEVAWIWKDAEFPAVIVF